MAATAQHAIKQDMMKITGGKKGRATMASKADRHVLYEDSVQCVEAEIDFVDETFKELRNRKARVLREDFCGTANTSCEWVRRRKRNRAIGVDLDADVQQWGRKHHLKKLGRAEKHVTLLNANVLDVTTEPVDIVLAMNFSYWIFKERALMKRYFRSVYESLVDDGIFFLDAYGGSDAYREMRERTEYDDFTYIWDQASFDPITGDMVCKIHFSFPDGSRMKNAFTYDWRLWTLPEVREILAEAGFKRVTVYWQGDDEDSDEGNGEFEPAEHGEADDAWIVYISAEK
jgi:cyclopropane fatty-acyl-phospholipid synthase-like methyltransferase